MEILQYWWIKAIFSMMAVLIYILTASFTSGYLRKHFPHIKLWVLILSTIFWPCFLALWLCSWVICFIVRLSQKTAKIGESIGAKSHKLQPPENSFNSMIRKVK